MATGRDIAGLIGQLLRPLKVRIANSIARGVVQLVDDATKLQLLQVAVLQLLRKGNEDIDDCERFQNYGFSSVPLPGAEAVLLFPNGDRGHPLVLAVDDRRHRPTSGQPGEVAIYTDEGDFVRLARGHIVLVDGATVKLGSGADALTPLQGVVQGECIEPVTGLTFAALGAVSTAVMAKKT